MNSTKGEAPVIGPTEASVSNQTYQRKTDMTNFNASTSSLATAEPLTTVTVAATTAATALVPVFTGALQGRTVQLCDARTLHAFMAVLRNFSNWIKGRISKFGFLEGVDYLVVSRSPELASGVFGAPDLAHQTRGGNRKELIDYHLTLDMAKELSMVENNAKGREARRYFMECEKQVLAALTAHPGDRIAYAVLPSQTLSAEQADTLRNMLTEACNELAKDLQGMFMREGWSKLKSHFKVGYREIPQSQFNEAVSLVTRHIVFYNGTKVVVAAPTKNALKALPAAQPTKTLQLMVITTEDGKSTVEMFPASDLPQMVMHMRDVFAAEEVLKIASHANLRMMGEVGRMGRDEDWEQFKKTARKLPAHRLNALAGDLWMELGARTILGNELACA